MRSSVSHERLPTSWPVTVGHCIPLPGPGFQPLRHSPSPFFAHCPPRTCRSLRLPLFSCPESLEVVLWNRSGREGLTRAPRWRGPKKGSPGRWEGAPNHQPSPQCLLPRAPQVSTVILPCTTRPLTPSTCLGVSASTSSWQPRPLSSTPCTVLTAPGVCWPLPRGQRSGKQVYAVRSRGQEGGGSPLPSTPGTGSTLDS